MKKLLLLTALGCAAFASQAAEALTDASFAGFPYDNANNLWKAATVKLSDTYFADNGWSAVTAPQINVTNQSISLTTPADMGYSQWQGQVKVLANVALSADNNYDFSCFVQGPADAKVTVKLATSNDAGAEVAALGFWNQASLTSTGKTCYYISDFTGQNCEDVLLIMDFGGYPNEAFTVSDMVLRIHQNDSDLPAEPTYDVPSTVPAPTQSADDVLSLFSSKYTNVKGFVPASWGQTTQLSTVSVDGQEIYFLKSFTFQGWTIDPSIDVTGYDYLHIDYWTADGENFAVTPINTNSTTGTTELGWKGTVQQSNWNSYDIPMSYWSAIDLSAVNQFKVDVQPAEGVYGYIANIYFYKDANGGGSTTPGEGNGAVYTGTITGTYPGTPQINGEDQTNLEYTVDWSAKWNTNGTVTFNVTVTPEVTGLVPQMFIGGEFKGNIEGGVYTTADAYAEGTNPNFALFMAYAGGNTEQIPFNYVVGSTNSSTTEPEPEPTPDEPGTITGTFTNASYNGVTGDYPYTVKWEGVTNEDMTVTLTLVIDPEVDGLSPQLFVDNAYNGNFTNENGKWSYTTEDTYTVGDTPAFALYMAYAGGATTQQAIDYTVTEPQEQEPETPLVGNGNTATGENEGVFEGATYEGVTGDIDFIVNWSATWNTDATVSFEISVDPMVVGLVPQLFVNNAFEANFVEENGKYTLTTTETFEEGVSPFSFYFAYAGGSVNVSIEYKVGSAGNYSGVENIRTNNPNASVEYYNLQGVKVSNPTHGIYIVNGKKVLVK